STGAVVDHIGTGLLDARLLTEVRARIRHLPDLGARLGPVRSEFRVVPKVREDLGDRIRRAGGIGGGLGPQKPGLGPQKPGMGPEKPGVGPSEPIEGPRTPFDAPPGITIDTPLRD